MIFHAGLVPSNEDPEIALDLRTYTALSYGNGPGFQGKNIDYNSFRREEPLVDEIGILLFSPIYIFCVKQL